MAAEGAMAWPLPDVANVDRKFWEELQKGNFVLQKCQDCGRLQFLPRPVCINCFSMNLDWHQSEGKGVIYSFTEVYVPARPATRKLVEDSGKPAIYAAIDLDEGVRVLSEIVDCKPEKVKIGGRVEVYLGKAPGTDFILPRFHLVKE